MELSKNESLFLFYGNDRIETILLIVTMKFFNNSNGQKDWLNNVAFAECRIFWKYRLNQIYYGFLKRSLIFVFRRK